MNATDILIKLEEIDAFEKRGNAICGHCGKVYLTRVLEEIESFAVHVYGCEGESNLIRVKETYSVKEAGGGSYFYTPVRVKRTRGFNYGLDA